MSWGTTFLKTGAFAISPYALGGSWEVGPRNLASLTRRSFSHPPLVDELQGCYFKAMRAEQSQAAGETPNGGRRKRDGRRD
jgi:hypothetical protein